MFTELVRERDGLNAAAIYPASLNNTNLTTGALDMSKFARCCLFGLAGAGATASVRAYLQETANSNGAGAVNISGAIITNIVNTANQQFTVEVDATQLTKRYVVGVIEENSAIAKIVSGVLIGTDHRYGPANTSDSTSVNQRV